MSNDDGVVLPRRKGSKTRGEGRSEAEKAGRIITPAQVSKERREARGREEQEWASKSGPVTIRKKDE